jgi:hypothetical protein
MKEQVLSLSESLAQVHQSSGILDKLPPEAKNWAESLPWNERRYLLSLCHLMCASSPEIQAEFLDDYTASGLVAKRLEDKDTRDRVQFYLQQFHINVELNEIVVRKYIKQFYIHSAQDVQRKPDMYLESALKLVNNAEEKNNIFGYILGFELLKIIFNMSWLEQERLYQLQKNQEEFFNLYIRPIQTAHKMYGIIVPKNDKTSFFSKRDYFVQKPNIPLNKLIELVIDTFPTGIITNLGSLIIRNLRAFVFDYEYIFTPELSLANWEM